MYVHTYMCIKYYDVIDYISFLGEPTALSLEHGCDVTDYS